MGILLFGSVAAVVAFFVVYWSVRMAVRDAIEDADERRARAASEPPRP